MKVERVVGGGLDMWSDWAYSFGGYLVKKSKNIRGEAGKHRPVCDGGYAQICT